MASRAKIAKCHMLVVQECSESPPFLGSALSALSGIGHLESLPSAAAAVRWATAAQAAG